jgi:hypothetical protein
MRVKLETKKKLLKVMTVNNTNVVLSLDYYKYVGLVPQNYTRWMKDTVFMVGEKGKDYWPTPYNIECKGYETRLRYFFTVDFAIKLCYVVRRNEAMQLKEFLMENK